jgi:hypothetical protein
MYSCEWHMMQFAFASSAPGAALKAVFSAGSFHSSAAMAEVMQARNEMKIRFMDWGG